MEIELIDVKNEGGSESEFLEFKVLNNTNLSNYLIIDTTYDSKGNVSNALRHTFWFPNQQVKKGDYIRLFIQKGKNEKYSNRANTTTYNYFWGLDIAILNNKKDCIVIIEVNSFESYHTT